MLILECVKGGYMNNSFLKKYSKTALSVYIGKNAVFSKIGGNPEVPKDFEWPMDKNNKKIPFFMQLDFGEINRRGKLPDFPRKGLLYLFMDDIVINTNFPLISGEHYKFLFYNQDAKDLHIENANVKKYPQMYLNTKKIQMYPNSEEYDELFDYIEGLTPSERDEYFEKFHFIGGEIGDIGGWPHILQSSYLQKDEMQLFELDSLKPSFMWGDLGMLQFYIKAEDLRNLKFDNVKANLETT